VAACITASGGLCTAASIAVGGLLPRPARASAVESALVGLQLSPAAIARAAGEVGRDLGSDVLGDLFASAEYRLAVAPVWVKRAIQAASKR
jgi:carbon-monoxide dehydrogenase medium subunit